MAGNGQGERPQSPGLKLCFFPSGLAGRAASNSHLQPRRDGNMCKLEAVSGH
ncbi:unnamed protein product, partial [Gulo gulo]